MKTYLYMEFDHTEPTEITEAEIIARFYSHWYKNRVLFEKDEELDQMEKECIKDFVRLVKAWEKV